MDIGTTDCLNGVDGFWRENYALFLWGFHFRKLAGRTIFITGASRGIGKAIALKAAQDGANIVVAAKTAEPHPKLPGTIYSAAEESKILTALLESLCWIEAVTFQLKRLVAKRCPVFWMFAMNWLWKRLSKRLLIRLVHFSCINTDKNLMTVSFQFQSISVWRYRYLDQQRQCDFIDTNLADGHEALWFDAQYQHPRNISGVSTHHICFFILFVSLIHVIPPFTLITIMIQWRVANLKVGSNFFVDRKNVSRIC